MRPISIQLRTLLAPAVVVLVACSLRAEDNQSTVITFNDHVKPILRKHCLKCHGNDEQNADLNLQTYATLMKGGSGGAVVKPGRPAASALFQAITEEDDAARMPPESPPVPAEHIALIRKWIETGLRETTGSKSLAPNATITFNPAANAAMKPEDPPAMPGDLPALEMSETARPLPIVAMAASPWAPLLAVSGYEHIRLFDIESREQIGALAFPEGVPHVLRFSANGGVLLAAGGRPVQSGSVVLFDVRTGKRLAQLGDELDAVMAAGISPDQRSIVLGGSGRVVKAYSTADGELRYKLTRHTDWVTAVAFSPDGKQLATADRAGGIHLWDAASGGILLTLSNHKASVRSLSWRGDSKVLASCGDDGVLTWWNTDNGFISRSHSNAHPPQRPAGTFGKLPNGVLSVSFSRDGWLMSGGRDRVARLWDTNSRQRRTFGAENAVVTQVAVSHDGKTVVAGDASGQVHFWDRSN